MPAFAYRHIKDLYPTFWSISADLVKAVTSEIQAKSTQEGGEKSSGTAVVEMGQWLSRATLDIIGVAGMGQNFNAIHDPNTELNVTYRKVFAPSKEARVLAMMSLIVPIPILRLLPVKRNDDINTAANTIRSVSRRLIQEKKLKMANKETRTDKDILSVALESGGFTDEQLVDQLMTFLAAGHETTASSMTWALLSLGRHPEMQKRLREEIRSNLPPIEEDPKAVTAEKMDHLPYLHAVCNEVLRLHSPVPLTRREAAKDTYIMNQFVPKGTDIILAPAATNTSKELWGPDAFEFNPDRWMGPGRANTGGADSNYSFLTFLHGKIGADVKHGIFMLMLLLGPRSCIGQAFAKAEFACLLAAVVGRFEMELSNKDAVIEIETGITSRPKGGLPLRMTVLEGW